MAKLLVSDDLWAVIAALLPPVRFKPKGGGPPIPDRAALTGILFVLKTGLPWEHLPAEMGCGSGMSCWRCLRDGQEVGVWAALHRTLLERLENAGQLDWSRASLDSASTRAKGGGARRPARGCRAPRARRTAAGPVSFADIPCKSRGCLRWPSQARRR